jgi:hypothetical protein
MPHLKPVGHQSSNWMVRFVLMVATAALTYLGTTSPRNKRQADMYLLFAEAAKNLTIMEMGSNTALEISAR